MHNLFEQKLSKEQKCHLFKTANTLKFDKQMNRHNIEKINDPVCQPAFVQRKNAFDDSNCPQYY